MVWKSFQKKISRETRVNCHLFLYSSCNITLTSCWKNRKIWIISKQTFLSIESNKLSLTLSWLRPLSWRNQYQSIDLRIKSMDLFLYDNSVMKELKETNDVFKNDLWTFDQSQTKLLWKLEMLQKLLALKVFFTKVIKRQSLFILWQCFFNYFYEASINQWFLGVTQK